MDSSRIPVLVGIAQINQRSDEPDDYVEPLDMMSQAIRLAAEDSGRTEILNLAEAIYVIKGLWSYKDPARAIARGHAHADRVLDDVQLRAGDRIRRSHHHRHCLWRQHGSELYQ